mgnify:CR=1 FL=1
MRLSEGPLRRTAQGGAEDRPVAWNPWRTAAVILGRIPTGSATTRRTVGPGSVPRLDQDFRGCRFADRCPRALGTLIKQAEVQFHHEVYNQALWSQF